jgi:hypothetical protein
VQQLQRLTAIVIPDAANAKLCMLTCTTVSSSAGMSYAHKLERSRASRLSGTYIRMAQLLQHVLQEMFAGALAVALLQLP